MKIQTSRFGEVEFSEDVLIQFPEGVLGFPEDQRYLLLEHDAENSPFKWLQSVDSPDLAFIVVDPLLLRTDFAVMIDSDTARIIGLDDAAESACMAIINVPDGNPGHMTANLKAPLVVNPALRLGRQIIIGSQNFSISEPVFPRLNERLAELDSQTQAVGTPDAATA